MMARYAETMSALDEIDSDSLSEADALYYMEVTLRITKSWRILPERKSTAQALSGEHLNTDGKDIGC